MRLPAYLRTLAIIFTLHPAWGFAQDGEREIPRVPERSGPTIPNEHLLVGLNYTGGQVRWKFSSRWAVEGRYQQGKTSSNYGDVKSQVAGLRLYRYFQRTNQFALYAGPDFDHAEAKTETSNFKTTGFVAGAFGGAQYRITPWLSIDADIGPYVISLKEQQTNLSSTNLDFVLNSALVLRIF